MASADCLDPGLLTATRKVPVRPAERSNIEDAFPLREKREKV